MIDEIDLPDVVAEVTAQSDRYEHALATNDVSTLDVLFWDSPRTRRFGATENLYGHAAIAAFRAARPADGLSRACLRRSITTYGRDAATVDIEFRRAGDARIGRQTQTWMRLPEGWRVVAAHVSFVEDGRPERSDPRRR